MNYAFLGRMIPPSMADGVAKSSRKNMQDAANALQWHIYEGLCQNTDAQIDILNVLVVGSYPQYYKKPFIKREKFSAKYGDNNINIGFCNVKAIKNYFIARGVKKELLAWCEQSTENRFAFMYTLHSGFLSAVKAAKKKYPDLKACAIVADLPNMASLSSKTSFLQRHFAKSCSDSTYAQLDTLDAFVLLTEQMADYLKIKVPYCVMEGIATKPSEEPDFKNLCEIKTVMYTGTLHKRFGILNLVEAFSLIKNDNYRLVLCGVGDAENEIRAAAEKDSRIEFLGQITRDEVLTLQKSATALVNPRQNTEEFTKYSFPSKNLEYLSSGKPLVAYKLDGIPNEYDDYIYYVDDNTIEALAERLIEVCESPAVQIEKHCRDAYDFVQTRKNEREQTKIILDKLKDAGII